MKIALLDCQTLEDKDVSLDIFNEFGNVSVTRTLKGEELKNFLEDKDVVLLNRSILTEEIISACKKLKYIGLFATGYNNVDLNAATKKGITVCNVPGYSTEAVAQQTVCFLLMLANNTESYSNYVKQGLWSFTADRTYFPFKITRLKGKTLGVFGMGNMGKRVSEICSAFGMRVIYYSRTKKDVPYEFVTKETLFKESDFLTFHCPANEDTKKVLNKETISLMKNSAFVINTARGALINEQDLAEALESGRLAGAAADVVEFEPLTEKSPLFKAKNMIFTPHIAWADSETRKELLEQVANNLKAFLNNRPINVVNK